ncbi:putative major facilitator superfamily, MFS transporter superfamily [Septoria linicola]|nr:putative major facilitator superfamily, MFS transporter superfamily [Septoria linicola]
MFIAALDQTIIATAIPTIIASLKSAAGYTWLGGAYLLANAIAGTLWTKGSDIWGRKLTLLAAVALFAAASLIAALATTTRMLIAARALQGTAGGGLFQLVAVTISDLFSIRERALYFGFMGDVWAVAGSAGPLLGGALAEKASWRYCFWINLPGCGLSFILLLVFLDVHNPRTKLKQGLGVIDWYGTACFLAFSALVLLGLNFGGGAFAWNSATVVCLLVVGSCMVGLTRYSERRLAQYPLMPMHIFKKLSNNAVILTAVGHSMISIGTEFYLPLYFQSVKQASPLRSGILLLPLICTAAITDTAAGILIHRTGRYKEFIICGVLLMTLRTGLCINLGTDTSLPEVIGFHIISGAGIALLFQTPMLAIHNTVAQSDVASAGSTLGFLRALATSVSVVLGGVVFQNSMNTQHSALVGAGLDPSTLDALSGNTAAANVDIVKTVGNALQKRAIKEAFAFSIRNIFIMYTSIAGMTVIASLFVKQRHMSTEHTETKTGIDNMSKRRVEEMS